LSLRCGLASISTVAQGTSRPVSRPASFNTPSLG
jgi:hypothetical protein